MVPLKLISQRISDSQEKPPCPSFPSPWKLETQFCRIVVLEVTTLSPSGSFCRWQNASLVGNNRTRWHCHLQTQFLLWIMLLFIRYLSKKPFLICKECVAWAHCIPWPIFLSLRDWCDVNLCVAGEGLTLVLFKIRAITSPVDNWLSTAWVSEPFPLISVICRCQPQHSFHVTWSLCVPRAGSSKEVEMLWRNFPTFFISPFHFPSLPLQSLHTFESVWAIYAKSDVTPVLTAIRRQPEGFWG